MMNDIKCLAIALSLGCALVPTAEAAKASTKIVQKRAATQEEMQKLCDNIVRSKKVAILTILRNNDVDYAHGTFSGTLEHRAYKDTTALHIAAEMGYGPIVTRLIELGADVNATDADGNTPLSLAKANNHTEIVETLKDKGAI